MANMIFSNTFTKEEEEQQTSEPQVEATVKLVKRTAETVVTNPVRPSSEVFETSVNVDNSSCVLPSKLKMRERSQSLCPVAVSSQQPKNNVIFSSVTVASKMEAPTSFIKNTAYSSSGGSSSSSSSTSAASASSGMLAKRVNRNAANAREGLIRWCRKMTDDYENVCITNFSSSWADGLAFCALIHHFLPDAFDYTQLSSDNRRHNFELAFNVAEYVFLLDFYHTKYII